MPGPTPQDAEPEIALSLEDVMEFMAPHEVAAFERAVAQAENRQLRVMLNQQRKEPE